MRLFTTISVGFLLSLNTLYQINYTLTSKKFLKCKFFEKGFTVSSNLDKEALKSG
ncbi:hypothetical protein HMPREF3211_01411 [Staphylococcus aureus]|nr:hypothetical protein HMPREF3211_01411 [Staphylococcus aureus]